MQESIVLYKRVFAALDGSEYSDFAGEVALSLVERCSGSELIGCHAYAANLHRTRFGDMEPGLPAKYAGPDLSDLRKSHEGLITDGMQIISDSYLEMLAKGALERKTIYRSVIPEGRNYVQILKAAKEKKADLLILGSLGQGGAEGLGSTAERVLVYSQGMDVLLMRRPWDLDGGYILVGVDGSDNSYSAMLRAVDLAEIFGARIKAVSVYDPFFHSNVFKSISASLPAKTKMDFDFSTQEKLHDDIIDEGLRRLYGKGLEKGVKLAEARGIEAAEAVLSGKICPQIHDFVSKNNISLIVLGRWGLHREQESMIGSNALRLARSSTANVLIVYPEGSSNNPSRISEQTSEAGRSMSFDRSVVSGENGRNGITSDQLPEAEIVVLSKTKRFAPDFHRHMLRGKMQGSVVKADDKILIYKVDETVPAGPVKVTERTRLEVR